MAQTTGISWTDSTTNFWIGCTKVSPACDHCYAERDWDHRRHRVEWGPHGNRSLCKGGPGSMRKLNRAAESFIAENGRRPTVFVNSLSDSFDNHRSILPEWRASLWNSLREADNVIPILVTKRPGNITGMLPDFWDEIAHRTWVLTTVENQEEADRRLPALIGAFAGKARPLLGVSAEPLIGPVRLDRIKTGTGEINALDHLRWVIAGGESGPQARSSRTEWFRSLQEQAALANVPFHFKQWGEWAPDETGAIVRMGRTVAGRMLDGREYDEFPNRRLAA